MGKIVFRRCYNAPGSGAATKSPDTLPGFCPWAPLGDFGLTDKNYHI